MAPVDAREAQNNWMAPIGIRSTPGGCDVYSNGVPSQTIRGYVGHGIPCKVMFSGSIGASRNIRCENNVIFYKCKNKIKIFQGLISLVLWRSPDATPDQF